MVANGLSPFHATWNQWKGLSNNRGSKWSRALPAGLVKDVPVFDRLKQPEMHGMNASDLRTQQKPAHVEDQCVGSWSITARDHAGVLRDSVEGFYEGVYGNDSSAGRGPSASAAAGSPVHSPRPIWFSSILQQALAQAY